MAQNRNMARNHITANGIRSGGCIMGRAAGRCAGFYNNFNHVEIILEKDLGGKRWW